MAVYKRSYKSYTGAHTATWPRFLILARYSYARLFQSKFLVLFMAVCLFYPLGCAAFIYLSHNLSFLETLNVDGAQLPHIDGRFFYVFCTVQGAFAYLLTAFVGPSLVSPDLANGAMPLYFSRPFSRTEYVAGKMILLLFLLSLITWIPGSVLYGIQASLAGWDWAKDNFWMERSVVLGCFVWITVLSLIALALSAWVKWKVIAGAGFGAAINSVMRTHYGGLIDLTQVVHTIWSDLLRYDSGARLTVGEAWTVLIVICVACLWLLAKRVRPFEVVK